jgi:hypothetical protein
LKVLYYLELFAPFIVQVLVPHTIYIQRRPKVYDGSQIGDFAKGNLRPMRIQVAVVELLLAVVQLAFVIEIRPECFIDFFLTQVRDIFSAKESKWAHPCILIAL